MTNGRDPSGADFVVNGIVVLRPPDARGIGLGVHLAIERVHAALERRQLALRLRRSRPSVR